MQTKAAAFVALFLIITGCAGEKGLAPGDGVFAPTIDPRGESIDGLVVGHRLMAAGEYELALDAFTRAAGQNGIDGEVLTALGSANLGLGRLGQSEKLLRQAIELEPGWAEAWNNLGVVLMERGKTSEATETFRRAYALDNGGNDRIRDNLRLALAKLENPSYGGEEQTEYQLVRRGRGIYSIRPSDG